MIQSKKLSILLSFLVLLIQSLSAQVVINEYSASNLSQFEDNYGKHEDWIELYNNGSSQVNLSGYFLSDDSLEFNKWSIPFAIIPSHGFLRIWASGRNEAVGGNIHTNFKLTQTKGGECLILSTPAGGVLDYIKLDVETQVGHSRGRTLDGANGWSIFKNPTPNLTNNTSTPYARYADRPSMSDSAGFYSSTKQIIITTDEPEGDIHYTTDGKTPTAASPIYTAPVNVAVTKVIKAITISPDPEVLPSFERFHTYFINVNHSTVVVSVSGTDLTELANGDPNLVPAGSFEFFDKNKLRTAKTYGEFNKHGQDSWVLSQRSIDFVARDEMGYNYAVKEKVFRLSDRDRFQRLILRAAGDDNYPADHNAANEGSAHMRDAYVHNLAKSNQMNLDVRAAEKAVVYINGQYWGVYDIREKPDDADYTEYYYNQDKYNIQYILTWGYTWAEYGGQQALDDWNSLYTYIMSHSMADPGSYQYVTNRYDATSLVDYVIVNAFTVCSDWLNYNTGWWRGQNASGGHKRWGYILWDNDATFGHYINYTGIPNTTPYAQPCDAEGLTGWSDPEGHIQLLNKLRENPDFNQYYIGRQIDMWNTTFSCETMLHHLDSIKAILQPEMQAHALRWGGTMTEWNANVQQLRDFIEARCNYLPDGFKSCYDLTGPYQLVINARPAGAGSVQLNSLLHDQLPWSGTYFGGIETRLAAFADTGYVFYCWSSGSQTFLPDSTSAQVSVNLTGNDTITAHFLPTTALRTPVSAEPVRINVYPNITSRIANIYIDLPKPAAVTAELYTMQGSELGPIPCRGLYEAGKHVIEADLKQLGAGPGLYLVKVKAGQHVETKKVILTAN